MHGATKWGYCPKGTEMHLIAARQETAVRQFLLLNCRAITQKPGNCPSFEKCSRSEKAILGATLGIPGYSRSNSRNDSHDLIYVKTLFSEQLSEQLSESVGRRSFSPNSRSVFFKFGVVPARQNYPYRGTTGEILRKKPCLVWERHLNL